MNEIAQAIEKARPWVSPINVDWSWYEPGIRRCAHTIATVARRYVRAGGTVLDYGAGPALKTAVLGALGYRCTAYDEFMETWHQLPGTMEAIRALADENNVELVAGGGIPQGPFDLVMHQDVLEHLSEPRELMNDLVERLNAGGILMVTVPNAGNIRKRLLLLCGGTNMPRFDEFWWYQYPYVGHVREYVRGDLVKMAGYLRLQVLELRGVDHMIQNVPAWLRPAYLAGTWLADGLKDTWLLVARKPKSWTPRRSR